MGAPCLARPLLVPLDALANFYGRHERHAQLIHLYPQAELLKDCVPRKVVEAYAKTFLDTDSPTTAYGCVSGATGGSYDRAVAIARDDNYVVYPKASADACLVAAYALRSSEEAFRHECWHGTVLSAVQKRLGRRSIISPILHSG